jgi:hypothetical protein
MILTIQEVRKGRIQSFIFRNQYLHGYNPFCIGVF